MAVSIFDPQAATLRTSVKLRHLSFVGGGPAAAPAPAALTVDRPAGVEPPTPRTARATSVLFCAAPLAPHGIGQLHRLERLAHQLGVRPQVLLRGGAETVHAARARGWTVFDATAPAIVRLQPELAVIDDASPLVARLWMRLARLFELPVASVRDFMRPCPAGDDLTCVPGWSCDAISVDSGRDDLPGRTLIALPEGEPVLPWLLPAFVPPPPRSLLAAGA